MSLTRPLATFGLVLTAASAVTTAATAQAVNTALHRATGLHPFTVDDLVMMDRVGDPQLSPDGRTVAFTVRRTDYAANRGITAVYVADAQRAATAVRVVDEASMPRWSADGRSLYYLAPAAGVTQLWRITFTAAPGAGAPHTVPLQVTRAPLDLDTYTLSPDGSHALLSYAVFTDCPARAVACTRERLDARARDKATGTVYSRLFVRHWDTWSDGRRNQLFAAAFDAAGRLPAEPVWLTRGINGDVPSKPSGDASEFAFAPNGRTVYFGVRIAGTSEPWSTNFDIYSVPVDGATAPRNLTASNLAWDAYPVPSPDGRTLYYLAMRTPGFESDRFAIMAMDLASGATREVDSSWDRSAGSLSIAPNGRALYATADDEGQHPLFRIDPATGAVTPLSGAGTVDAYSVSNGRLVLARDDLTHPADLYTLPLEAAGAAAGPLAQLTHVNAAALAAARMGTVEFFTFAGWHGDTVQAYVVRPVGFEPAHRYPVAFIVHGGPQGAMGNAWSYRWNPQTYAGQGFALVTVNFHGSTGYGQAFTNSISGDWGGKPLEDLRLGWAAALGKYPFLDGDRACALGASYGGYMIYWMAGVWNGPWKCFVDHDGVFDTRAMYYDTDELWFEERENGGTQYEHPDNYERFNPLDHVADWRVPMLVVHSRNDFRIPITQGLGAFTALQRRGIPSELLTFPDETHFVLKPHNSVQWHRTVNAWLERWTSGDTTGAAPHTP